MERNFVNRHITCNFCCQLQYVVLMMRPILVIMLKIYAAKLEYTFTKISYLYVHCTSNERIVHLVEVYKYEYVGIRISNDEFVTIFN